MEVRTATPEKIAATHQLPNPRKPLTNASTPLNHASTIRNLQLPAKTAPSDSSHRPPVLLC
jgi:hypothetical protein